MSTEQKAKRKRIMARSITLGHCVCDPRKPCPCPLYKEADVCECAGEHLPVPEGSVQLTDHVRAAGCASKIGKKDLLQALTGLPALVDPRVVVNNETCDDAGVIMLDEDKATVLTVDIFAPSVDDPYTFGRIAAANSLSDVWAMGGKPQAALSIIGFPIHTLPHETMGEILRGGSDAMHAAQVPVVGGHSINDGEVKCGYAVVGHAPRDGYITNSHAQPGDAIVLTKPLGTGLIAFGAQIHRVLDSSIREIEDSMSCFNQAAGEAMRGYGAHAATDVTGYGFLGHLVEMARQSGVRIEIDFDALPLFHGVRELACMDAIPGAVERNREAVSASHFDFEKLTEPQRSVLFGPETSGGLLVSLPAKNADSFVGYLHGVGVASAAIVGYVNDAYPDGVVAVTSSTQPDWLPQAIASAPDTGATAKANASAGCCAGGSTTQSTECCSTTPQAEARESCCERAAREPRPTTGGLVPLPEGASDAFKEYMGAVSKPGALGSKEKKLISLALSVVTKCEPCVKIQTNGAREAGATDAEIAEAAALGVSFGGATVAMFYNQLLNR